MNRQKALLKMARRYYRTCNAAYNRIATGRGMYGKVPKTQREVDRINYVFKFEKQWLKDVEYFNGYKPSEINKAIKDYKSIAMREFPCIMVGRRK